MKKTDFPALFEELKKISHQALAECPAPTPMIVGHPSTLLGNDVDFSKEHWFVADGVCGFAYVVLDSGRTGFAQWLKKNDLGRTWWSNGRERGVGVATYPRLGFAEPGQSFEKNKYVASKIASHLRLAGLDAWVDARID